MMIAIIITIVVTLAVQAFVTSIAKSQSQRQHERHIREYEADLQRAREARAKRPEANIDEAGAGLILVNAATGIPAHVLLCDAPGCRDRVMLFCHDVSDKHDEPPACVVDFALRHGWLRIGDSMFCPAHKAKRTS